MFSSHNSWYMGVDLKVYLGIVYYKGRRCCNMGPPRFCFCWVRHGTWFLANDLAPVYLMRCRSTIGSFFVSMCEERTFWIVRGRDTIDPRTILQSSEAVWLISKKCFAKAVSKEKEAHGSPWPTQHLVGSREPEKRGPIPTRPCICPWLSPWSLSQLPFTCSLSASQQHNFHKYNIV